MIVVDRKVIFVILLCDIIASSPTIVIVVDKKTICVISLYDIITSGPTIVIVVDKKRFCVISLCDSEITVRQNSTVQSSVAVYMRQPMI